LSNSAYSIQFVKVPNDTAKLNRIVSEVAWFGFHAKPGTYSKPFNTNRIESNCSADGVRVPQGPSAGERSRRGLILTSALLYSCFFNREPFSKAEAGRNRHLATLSPNPPGTSDTDRFCAKPSRIDRQETDPYEDRCFERQ